ncbi:hypothetical protein ACS5NO_20610 [Larkinella sp. GY13]|uniref:hypothetical protein n=1 Tax=Larkinella sp. GY13 TaxID=3453720 RepID=UPI003EEDAF20
MSFRRLSDKQNQLYNYIDELLWREWDPIGINDCFEARDEYSTYAGQMFSLVVRGAIAEELAQKLLSIEQEMMGLSGNMAKNLELARKLKRASEEVAD